MPGRERLTEPGVSHLNREPQLRHVNMSIASNPVNTFVSPQCGQTSPADAIFDRHAYESLFGLGHRRNRTDSGAALVAPHLDAGHLYWQDQATAPLVGSVSAQATRYGGGSGV
jgi:hypothetical protein